MRCALLLEQDPKARREIGMLLHTLGYIVACTELPRTAINTASAVHIDLVLTSTTLNQDDRRSFVSEIARMAPDAPVILLQDEPARVPSCDEGCSGVIVKPVTVSNLRRVIEFGVDGCGAAPGFCPRAHERRRQAPRRVRPR
jgi:DNA-binding NtrC family response regulator